MPRDKDEPRPLNRQELKFVQWFRQYRDIYKAAAKAHVPKTQAVKLFHKIEIQEEIERQDNVLHQERARQQVEIENLSNEMLDRELVKFIRGEKGALVLEAIRLAYVTTGRIQAGATRVLDAPASTAGGGNPNFYQAFVPMGVAVTPIMPEPAPDKVPQGAGAAVPPVRGPYVPPGAQPPAPAAPPKPPQPPPVAPPTGTPPRKAGKLTIG